MFSRQKAVCSRNVFPHFFRRQGCLKSPTPSATAQHCSAHTSAVAVDVKYICTYVLHEITRMTEPFIPAGDSPWLMMLTETQDIQLYPLCCIFGCSSCPTARSPGRLSGRGPQGLRCTSLAGVHGSYSREQSRLNKVL